MPKNFHQIEIGIILNEIQEYLDYLNEQYYPLCVKADFSKLDTNAIYFKITYAENFLRLLMDEHEDIKIVYCQKVDDKTIKTQISELEKLHEIKAEMIIKFNKLQKRLEKLREISSPT